MKENNKVLIEVAAQHPLVNGKPGEEFEYRLKKGIQIYNNEKEKGNKPIIYIPGSLHSIKKNNKWESDEKTLSEAGKKYLLENGITEQSIRSEETNMRFKEDGVYNSADECLVATLIAKNEGIDRIVSIASPVQISRKALFYLEFGFLPEMYGVGLEKTYHNYIEEIFWSLYITYFIDHTWQKSYMYAKLREERDKKYKITKEIKEVINKGIQIPEKVNKAKEHMMSLYIHAQRNMLQRVENKGIIIGIEVSKEQEKEMLQEKINTVLFLCDQYKNNKENISVCVYGENTTKVKQILKKGINEKIKIIKLQSYENTLKYFKSNDISKIYHIIQ